MMASMSTGQPKNFYLLTWTPAWRRLGSTRRGGPAVAAWTGGRVDMMTMERKGRGRPKGQSAGRDLVTVKISRKAYDHIRYVANQEGVAIADYLDRVCGRILEHRYERAVRDEAAKLEGGGK